LQPRLMAPHVMVARLAKLSVGDSTPNKHIANNANLFVVFDNFIMCCRLAVARFSSAAV
jgi:hypothetical protein